MAKERTEERKEGIEIPVMEDTIAAIATPFGEGGIGVIRISGEDSLSVLQRVFRPASGSTEFTPRKMVYGKVVDPEDGSILDEAMAVYLKAPASYTGEDSAEIDCHGSMVSLRRILSLLLRSGARIADRGEFTKRAFLNGKMDLSQAEAVMDLVSAKTDKTFDVAMDQLEGKFSAEIREIRSGLMDTLVDITVNIDYPDEDIEELTYQKLGESLKVAEKKVSSLLSGANTGKIIRDGLHIAIIGKPNVGKSSLMNELLRESRAIVTDIPGTTRDTVEDTMSIDGIPVILTDTAGIRETEDKIEKVGIERSRKSFNEADMAIFVCDRSMPLSEEDLDILEHLRPGKDLVLLNKSDLGLETEKEEIERRVPGIRIIETSMTTGEFAGVPEIEQAILDVVYADGIDRNRNSFVTNIRHVGLLNEAEESLRSAMDLTGRREPLEIIEIDVSSAYHALGEIIGEDLEGDVLEEVFSRFCLGK
ncbi:MAG: tRNA uridine-5-carboxymethylaminomethyl(34) synthesis GTPase MnmE [Anaerovoracaceae bacterium]